ncbi:MAG TPA: S1C family serine protease [Bryobacteraceae bacterium]|nr:S1C family serine protease [Bryobacteraceae bacterium]
MGASQRAYALLILLFLLSFGYWSGGAVSLYKDLRFGRQRARPPFDLAYRQTTASVAPEAERAGAHRGDKLLEFNGRPVTGYHVVRDGVIDTRPGSVVRAVIQRPDGTIVPIGITLAPQRAAAAPFSARHRARTGLSALAPNRC